MTAAIKATNNLDPGAFFGGSRMKLGFGAVCGAIVLMAGSAYGATAKGKPVAHPSGPAAPAFDFKGATAGAVMDPATIGKCGTPRENGEVVCSPFDNKVAGLDSSTGPSLYFYKGRLTTMIYLFDGDDFVTVLDGFTQKYGRPCATDHPKWQSKGGSTFDNSVVTWCFKSGKLKLSQMSVSRDYADATYTDVYQAPSKTVPVDF